MTTENTTAPPAVDPSTAIAQHLLNKETAGLAPAQRAIVMDLAGGDPVRALRTIDALKAQWAAPTPLEVALDAVAPSPPPPLAAPSASEAALSHYDDLRAQNPFRAAALAARDTTTRQAINQRFHGSRGVNR